MRPIRSVIHSSSTGTPFRRWVGVRIPAAGAAGGHYGLGVIRANDCFRALSLFIGWGYRDRAPGFRDRSCCASALINLRSNVMASRFTASRWSTRSTRRQTFRPTLERLEDRRVLAAGALVGVDFGLPNTSVPTNWNHYPGGATPMAFSGLMDEDGDPSSWTLAVQASSPNLLTLTNY